MRAARIKNKNEGASERRYAADSQRSAGSSNCEVENQSAREIIDHLQA